MTAKCPKCKKRINKKLEFDDEERMVYKSCNHCGFNQGMDIDTWQNLGGTYCDQCSQWIDF